ncbi:unnamed protein product [Nesidiocoris tenuis]|uniref:Uncharacterized protein n=1 Tax=Nesidiocoris tenuis TaxID=355587 RepID=A0A6H5H344_9HEMI|nr:unnamed protein product [Nesidiocoris tenuis]
MDLPLPNSMDTNRASIGESPGDRNWLDDSDDRFTSVSQAAERLPTKLTLIPPKRKQSPKKPKRRRAISESSSSDNSIESDSSTLFLKPKIRRNPPRKTNSRDTPPDKRAKTTRTVAVESSSSDSDEDLALCLPVSAAKDKNADASEKTCDLPSINTRETQDVEEREMSAAEVSPSFLARITRRPGCPENVDKNSCPEASTSSKPKTLKQPEKRVKLYSKFDNSYYFEPDKLPTLAARPSEKPTEEDKEDPAQESDSADEEAPIVSQVPEKEAVKYPVVSLIDILAGSPRREKEVTCEDLQADPATNKTGEDSETASKHESAEGRRWGKKYSQKKKGVPTRKTSRIGSSMPDLEAGESSSDNNTTGVPNPPATAPAVSDDLGDRISDGDNLNQGNDNSSLEPIPARHRISQDSDVEVILSSLGLEQSKHKDQSKTDFPEVSIQEVAKVLNDCYSPKEKTAMDVYRDLLSDREAKESSQDANLALPLASVGLETDDAVPDSAAPVNAAPDNPVPANAEPAIAVTDETTADIVVPDCPPETDLATTVDLQVAPALLEVTHVADDSAKVPLCTQFAFVANVRTRRPPGHLLPIIVAHEEAEHFLGLSTSKFGEI